MLVGSHLGIHMPACVGCVYVAADAQGNQRRGISLEMELRTAIGCLTWMLGTKLRSTAGALHALMRLSSQPLPAFNLFLIQSHKSNLDLWANSAGKQSHGYLAGLRSRKGQMEPRCRLNACDSVLSFLLCQYWCLA